MEEKKVTTRRLIIVGGIIAFTMFGLWAKGKDFRFAGFASRQGVISWREGNDLFIMTGQDTTDAHFVARTDSTREKRIVDLAWIDELVTTLTR